MEPTKGTKHLVSECIRAKATKLARTKIGTPTSANARSWTRSEAGKTSKENGAVTAWKRAEGRQPEGSPLTVDRAKKMVLPPGMNWNRPGRREKPWPCELAYNRTPGYWPLVTVYLTRDFATSLTVGATFPRRFALVLRSPAIAYKHGRALAAQFTISKANDQPADRARGLS